MSGTLVMRRQAVGIELRRGTFEVVLDGRAVGTIERDETLEVDVEPGSHSLLVRAGKYKSQVRPFDLADGSAVNFRCHGAMLWPRYVASIFKPDLAISLRQQ